MTPKPFNFNKLAARPSLPAPRVVDVNTRDFKKVVQTETQISDADTYETDKMIHSAPPSPATFAPTESNIADDNLKLSRLVDDDFPFDETQLAAITGILNQQYACMIGAAGTGKTTSTKKLVDGLRDGLDEVDMSTYWKRGVSEDPDDDYEIPTRLIPSIVMVSFTGRSTQMTKKNFPRDWHGNIMTIHRALGFYPEYTPAYDEESGMMKNKRMFVPAYTAENKMPWDIIVIDEAGMLGLDLWHQLWAACKPTTRIIMIGDINQLPPTHGKSILGFALASWPTWELTHIHRQKGANNSIVDNAHRILKGHRPISDCASKTASLAKGNPEMLEALNFMVKDKTWRFAAFQIPEDHRKASTQVRRMLKLLQGRFYDPNRDVVITPINGFEQTSPGYALGQAPMNQELVTSLNSESPRYFIDAGRERQNFAVGDKVMATINDYEAGVTNGMTGIVTSIAVNAGYAGDPRRFGLITEVNDYLDGLTDGLPDEDDFTLDDIASDESFDEEIPKKEERDAGPASHIVTVRFGEGEHGFEINFDSKSRVASLMLAYVATCHKMQGGECPIVFVIVHNGHKRPLNREWLYTAVTRASERCIVLYTTQGIGFALSKQNIKGVTLQQKVQTFIDLTKKGLVGASVKVKLPQARSLSGEVIVQNAMQKGIAREETQPEAGEAEPAVESPAAAPQRTINIKNLHIHVHPSREVRNDSSRAEQERTVDGGELRAESTEPRPSKLQLAIAARKSDVPSKQLTHREAAINQVNAAMTIDYPAGIPQVGAVRTMLKIEDQRELKLLTHQPAPVAPPKKLQMPQGLAALIARQKQKG